MKNSNLVILKVFTVIISIVTAVIYLIPLFSSSEYENIGEDMEFVVGARVIFIIVFYLTMVVHLVQGGLFRKDSILEFVKLRESWEAETILRVFVCTLITITFVYEWIFSSGFNLFHIIIVAIIWLLAIIKSEKIK